MPLEAVTEKISLSSRGKGETIQILTEGDMIVPDINPDIYQSCFGALLRKKDRAAHKLYEGRISHKRLYFRGRRYGGYGG